MGNDRSLRWLRSGLWVVGGAFAMGAMLAYLTNWEIGTLSGLTVAVVLAVGLLPSRATTQAGTDEEADLSERLRDSPVYSDVPGNRFFAE